MNNYSEANGCLQHSIFHLTELKQIAHRDPEDRALFERWVKLTLILRCGLYSYEPNYIRLYIASGQRLISEGVGKPIPLYLRMLQTLVITAEDEELPVTWRQNCAEHLDILIARLRTLLRKRDPSAANALISRVDALRARF